MGAAKVVGIDVSPGMINGAKSHEKKGQNEYFLVGNAAALKEQLMDKSAECNLMVRIFLWVWVTSGFLDLMFLLRTFHWRTAWGQFRYWSI